MQLKLTWRIEGQRDVDVIVNPEQTIVETIHVLVGRGIVDCDNVSNTKYVKSIRQMKQVNTLLSYDEAAIYTGDIIELI